MPPPSNSCPYFPSFSWSPLTPKARRSQTHAEDAPEMADVYFAYGKALLENAIVQEFRPRKGTAAAAGRRAEDANATRAFDLLTAPRARTEPATNGNNKILSFSGDAEDEEEDPAVDLFARPSRTRMLMRRTMLVRVKAKMETETRSLRMTLMLHGRFSTSRGRYTRSAWRGTT
jgi:hypothetical protein